MRGFTMPATLAGTVLGCALHALAPGSVFAHETRTIAGGAYQIVIGFMNEPVFAGDKSGLEFWVTEVSAATPAAEESEGTPAEGLAETLQAEVIYEDQTLALPLSPVFGEPGGSDSVFYPMASGDYTFRIFGAIGDVEIDESFPSSPEGFGVVADPTPLQFPAVEESPWP